MKSYVKSLYKKLSEVMHQSTEAIHCNYFELRDGDLYFPGKRNPLTTGRRLKPGTKIMKILGKGGLQDMGFKIVVGSKIMAQQAIALNRVEKELPSAANIGKLDNIELQEITDRATKSMENLIWQLEGKSSKDLPIHKLLGLDKQLRSIRGALKRETVKKVQLEQHIM